MNPLLRGWRRLSPGVRGGLIGGAAGYALAPGSEGTPQSDWGKVMQTGMRMLPWIALGAGAIWLLTREKK